MTEEQDKIVRFDEHSHSFNLPDTDFKAEVAADDNPMKLMSIAMKPLSQPPFPLEKIEEMTALMGGDGQLSYG